MRCGEIGEDRRTLWMACFYAMEELDIPFEQKILFIADEEDCEPAKDPVVIDLPSPENHKLTLEAGTVRCKGELTPRGVYTLRVCKNCRAEWMNMIETWFKAGKTIDKPTGTGVYMRRNGANVELMPDEVQQWRAAHGGVEPCRVGNRCPAVSPEGYQCDMASGHVGPHQLYIRGRNHTWTWVEKCPEETCVFHHNSDLDGNEWEECIHCGVRQPAGGSGD